MKFQCFLTLLSMVGPQFHHGSKQTKMDKIQEFHGVNLTHKVVLGGIPVFLGILM